MAPGFPRNMFQVPERGARSSDQPCGWGIVKNSFHGVERAMGKEMEEIIHKIPFDILHCKDT